MLLVTRAFGRPYSLQPQIAAALSVFVLLPAEVWSTSCPEPTDADREAALQLAVEHSDFVFLGVPLGRRADNGPTDMKVLRIWKGPDLSELPMRGTYFPERGRVYFASRAQVGGWVQASPSCAFFTPAELPQRLSETYGQPRTPPADNKEDYEILIVASIFFLLGLISIIVFTGSSILNREHGLRLE